MERDEFYNQAFTLFADGEYEKAYDLIGSSSTISPQECENFKAKCLNIITQQYIYIIKQEVADDNIEEALRYKNSYTTKYGNNDSINELIDDRATINEVADKREVRSGFYKRNIWFCIPLVIIIIVLIYYFINQSDNIHNYEEAVEEEIEMAEVVPQFDLYATDFSGLLNAKFFDPFGGWFGDPSKMMRITFRLKLFKDQTYSSTVITKVTDASIKERLQNAGEKTEFETFTSGTFNIDGNDLILRSSDGNSDKLIIDRENRKLKFYVDGQLAGELSQNN